MPRLTQQDRAGSLADISKSASMLLPQRLYRVCTRATATARWRAARNRSMPSDWREDVRIGTLMVRPCQEGQSISGFLVHQNGATFAVGAMWLASSAPGMETRLE
jgi:hypothetical protein